MIIVDKETLETFNELEVAAMYRHAGFDFADAEIVNEALEPYGLAVVNMPTQPVFDSRYQVATVGTVVENEGVYSSTWDVSYIDLTKEQRAELITDKRYWVEIGGTTANGADIPTDRDTRRELTAIYVKAKEDENLSVRFKMPYGWVTLTAPEIISVSNMVYPHVQAAFVREEELLIAIENGEPITPDDW